MKKPKMKFKPDPQGIYVVTKEGESKWLDAPFSAYCMNNIGSLKADSLVYVDEVGYTSQNVLVYVISGVAYSHDHFIVDSSY